MPSTELAAALLTVSLANAVLLLWLGMTVLLNAERRTWGMWLAGGALLLGGLFFVMQGSEAAYGWGSVVFAVHFQWPLGWFIGLSLPLAWYATMLWHAGFWESRDAPVRRAHRLWLWGVLAFSAVVFGLAASVYRYPRLWYGEDIEWHPLLLGTIPLLTVAYPVFIVLCMVLSVDVLRRPSRTERAMGELAHRRSRPWLIATSVGMLMATLVLGAIMVLLAANPPRSTELGPPRLAVYGLLATSTVILVSVLLLGQAVVAYEIFTGKTLPRGGLRRHWHWAVTLALVYGIVVGRSVAVGALSGLGLPTVTLVLAVLFALFNWRTFSERDRYMESLRPFLASPRVYDALLEPDAGEIDAATPFAALCQDVLGAERAYLVSVGPLSGLTGRPLAYPETAEPPRDIARTASDCTSPDTLFLAVDPNACGGASWAVPLWSERGLVGVLLLGPKADGGLYTQEEMEIARASGERLIDTIACARMAQQLMALQRQWLADSRVRGRQARQVIHDDVLPWIHAAMLKLSAVPDQPAAEAVRQLADAHKVLSRLLHELPTAGESEIARTGVIRALRATVEEEFEGRFDEVIWDTDPDAEKQAARLPASSAHVVFHAAREAVRNAARHGRQGSDGRPLHLTVRARCGNGLEITIEDDGTGFDASAADGPPGQGIAIHSTMMAVIGGTWTAQSSVDEGTRITLSLSEGALRPLNVDGRREPRC